MRRQLAAIVFADMVGFTALMQRDEETAHTLRGRYRQVLVARVSGHGGRIRQYYGDGALSTFDSAVEAVRCAVEMQLELAREPKVDVRIGVHTGDIVHDPDGVYGDGVNVASRIQDLCPPGGVMISAKVFDEVKNHPSISTTRLGPVRLRNVARPMEVYAVSNEGLPVPSLEELRKSQPAAAGRPTTGPDPEIELSETAGAGEAFLHAVRERAMLPWAIAYVIGAGIVLVGVRFAAELLDWPPVVARGADLLAFFGFLVTLVVSWHHGQRGRQRIRRAEVALIGALLLAAVGALGLIGSRVGDSASPAGTRVAASLAGDVRPSVAVLPFANHSPDPDDAYFAHGVQEDITTALSRLHSIRVPGRWSVERYRESRPDNRRIAATLGVDYLLEGSARIAGGVVKVTVALVDARTDERMWSEEYDRVFTVEQMIAVQADVAREVAQHLTALITPEDSARMAELPTTVSEAWVRFQRARVRWSQRTEADVREAIRLFESAIDLDATFAEAWAGLADAFLVMANWGWMGHRVAYARGRASADRALELDSLLAGAHASLGGIHLWSSRDWSRSEEHFRRAIELDPENSYAHYWYSALLGALGRHEEAVTEASLAWRIDPLAPQVAYGLARSHFMARDYERAAAEARNALELHPDYGNLHGILCSARIAAGLLDEPETESACARSGGSLRLDVAILRAHQGRRQEALAELRRAGGAEGGAQPVIVAMLYAGLGDVDEAVELLRRAVDEGHPHVEYLSNHPFFDGLQADPRYQELVRRLGLPAST